MDRKMVGVLGAAVASAVAFLWWQSEDDDVEIEGGSYGFKGDDPKKTKHLMFDSEEEDDEDDEDDEDISSISEEDSDDEEDDESTEEEKAKPSKKKSKSTSKK